jgi:hypothetical protein
MADQLQKLRPDRDLQCYFLMPSAIAALSKASADGFTVSGTWRQQFDWAVVEWNRDNVFEHPSFRNLPDGDLSGLVLTYRESRQNCIALDSDVYPTVDWPYLRVFADTGAGDRVYWLPLAAYATPYAGELTPASIDLTLQGSPAGGDYVGFSFLDEHYTHQLYGSDTLSSTITALADAVNAFSPTMGASVVSPATIHLSYLGASGKAGANGNRVGVYTFVSGSESESWDQARGMLTGGKSPTEWDIRLDFSSLTDRDGNAVPTKSVRKLRWTWAADLQSGAYVRSEFQVSISNWAVTGNNATYVVNGRNGFRIEDDDPRITYSGEWSAAKGNFSGGTIHLTQSATGRITCTYSSASAHSLMLGSRAAFNGGRVAVCVDGGDSRTVVLSLPGEDVPVRKMIAELPAGAHTVVVQNESDGGYFYFDFLEIVIPTGTFPTVPAESVLALATDWDTEHCLALAPERTAWMIQSLGFHGRVNHYAGALWFFELINRANIYATGTVTFMGTPVPDAFTKIMVGRTATEPTVLSHQNLYGDTAETIATAFELVLNQGSTAVWAKAAGPQLTLQSRSMGQDGNAVTLDGAGVGGFDVISSATTLTGGADGVWLTDLNAMPRLNRAARDWSKAFFIALREAGLECVTAFSTELQFGDVSEAAGIAQVYPSGNPVVVNTPALQTNFSPASRAYWQQVYADMAAIQSDAGLQPYLQFGEIQWWYFPDDESGLPFYDPYTTSFFQTTYGRDLPRITDRATDPAGLSQETAFLRGLISSHTRAIAEYVRSMYPSTRIEVLYPPDVNNTALMQSVNYASDYWTPENLDCLKTESFSYTFARDLNLSLASMKTPDSYGFGPKQRSHLVGDGDSGTAWQKEARLAEGLGYESVVLFALDQMCLLGHRLPIPAGIRRSQQSG